MGLLIPPVLQREVAAPTAHPRAPSGLGDRGPEIAAPSLPPPPPFPTPPRKVDMPASGVAVHATTYTPTPPPPLGCHLDPLQMVAL